jgi:pimeloyl-ACP methyl ester carboxylesterase
MPTLVLCGANDRFNVPLSKALAARLPDARFELVPDAGHVANLDNPEAFNAALERFLAL